MTVDSHLGEKADPPFLHLFYIRKDLIQRVCLSDTGTVIASWLLHSSLLDLHRSYKIHTTADCIALIVVNN